MSTTEEARILTSGLRSRPGDLDIVNWPFVQDGWRSAVYVCLMCGVASAVYYASDSLASTTLSVMAMLISMWRFWLPVRFQLSHAGIVQTCLGRQRLLSWRSVRRCEALENGVLLFFDTDRSPLSWLSTLYIDWRGQREEMLQLLESYTRENRPGGRFPARR